jgi:hypothetical protein
MLGWGEPITQCAGAVIRHEVAHTNRVKSSVVNGDRNGCAQALPRTVEGRTEWYSTTWRLIRSPPTGE